MGSPGSVRPVIAATFRLSGGGRGEAAEPSADRRMAARIGGAVAYDGDHKTQRTAALLTDPSELALPSHGEATSNSISRVPVLPPEVSTAQKTPAT